MAAAVPTIGAFNGAPLNLNGSGGGGAVLASSFLGTTLKKVMKPGARVSSGSFRVAAEVNEKKQTSSDRWGGLVEDVSDDQQDITRGKGLVDSLFQAPTGMGTHDAILSSYEYISQGLRDYGHLDNKLDGLYISPSFMDKLVVHISKNFMTLPNIKILIPRVDSSQNCESNPPQTVQVRNFDRFDSSSKLVFVSKSSLGTVQVRMTDFDSPQNSSILILLEPKTFGLKVIESQISLNESIESSKKEARSKLVFRSKLLRIWM